MPVPTPVVDARVRVVEQHAIYAVIAIGLTAWLARTLHAHGAVFLEGVFDDRPEMAAAVNRLLVVGFYMLNLGYAFLLFRTNDAATTVEATETLITKLGVLLVSLGVIHFVNMAVFWKIRNRAIADDTLPLPHTASVLAPPPPAHTA